MFELKIIPDVGEPFDVTATSRDIAAWERGGKQRSMGRLTEELRMTDIIDMAWYAASRRDLTDLDIVQWRAGVDLDFELTKDKTTDTDDDQESTEPVDTRYSVDARELEDGETGGPTRPGR